VLSPMRDPSLPQSEAGEVLQGRYQLAELVGRGGMAVVYRATDLVLDRPVAVKLLHPSLSHEPEFVESFLAMERRIARLFHPNLVTIFDTGLLGDTCYVVMEFVGGGSLRQCLTSTPPPSIAEVVRALIQVASALDALHRVRIVHGDVKPDNILLDEYGNAKLVDFGISRLASTTSQVVRTESIGGSAPYLAPEQLASGQYDARSDLYSLGLVGYELLSGRKAFEGENWVAVAAARLARDPQPLTEVRPDLPPELVAIISRCLARDPAARYASAQELCSALAALNERERPAVPPPQPADELPLRPAPEPLPRSAASAGSPGPSRWSPWPELAAAPSRPLPRRAPAAALAERQSPLVALLQAEHPFWAPLAGSVIALDIVLLIVLLRLI
jgi:eukaryotic-like serine/threonine-protein kinase